MIVINIPIYEVRLIVSIGQSDKKFLSSLKKEKYKCKKECLISDAEAYFIPFTEASMLIRLKEGLRGPEDYGFLVHECLHATIYILARAGFKMTRSSEEAYTYLQEYIITEILKQMK